MFVNLALLCLSLSYPLIFGLKANPSILIIGSGPAGIAAASKLWKNNFTNLNILEAENRIGGRINSVKLGDSYIDLGAEWCHGEKGNIVYNTVKEFNILKPSVGELKLFYSNGSLLDDNFAQNLITFVVKFILVDDGTCENYTSTGECLNKRFNLTFVPNYKDDPDKLKVSLEAVELVENYVASYSSPFTVYGMAVESDYIQCEGDLGLSWNGRGYKTILEVMLQKYPDPKKQLPIEDKIFFNKEVTKISWNNRKSANVTVRCSDNSSLEADFVIFTPSLGVLKADYDKIFEPELPDEKVKAIQNFGFAAVMKISLHFPKTWWNLNETYGFVWSTEDKNKIPLEFNKGPIKDGKSWLREITEFYTPGNNSKVLTTYIAGEMVPDIEKENSQVLLEGCMYLFRKFLGHKYSIVDADAILQTKWYSNPHFRGTYSYDSVKSVGQKFPGKLASPLTGRDGIPRVLFAGEATHLHYYSTVHGAIETGYREADRIISLYNQQK